MTEDRDHLVHWYTAFATDEARGASEIYEELSLAVTESPELLDFLLTLPRPRRQPNLFLAAVRRLHGVRADAAHLRKIVRDDHDGIRALMFARTTQTNEPARCAVLLPVLARLPPPLALIEVGASAGLCLLPDRYGYHYGAGIVELSSKAANAPIFPCRTNGAVPLPRAVPRIVWRRGLDLNPVDLRADEEVAWLEALVWPGQDERLHRLRAAIAIARSEPPLVVKGDLLTDLETLIAAAPDNATLVVFHTAVLAYVRPQEHRDRFAATMMKSNAVWISNEAPGAFPAVAQAVPPRPSADQFLLTENGVPLAWTAPHGQSIDWFGAA